MYYAYKALMLLTPVHATIILVSFRKTHLTKLTNESSHWSRLVNDAEHAYDTAQLKWITAELAVWVLWQYLKQ